MDLVRDKPTDRPFCVFMLVGFTVSRPGRFNHHCSYITADRVWYGLEAYPTACFELINVLVENRAHRQRLVLPGGAIFLQSHTRNTDWFIEESRAACRQICWSSTSSFFRVAHAST